MLRQRSLLDHRTSVCRRRLRASQHAREIPKIALVGTDAERSARPMRRSNASGGKGTEGGLRQSVKRTSDKL